jgi:formate dehydrogenase subunit gamma
VVSDSKPDSEVVDRAIASHREEAGALLPILHAIQDQLGWIPAEAVASVAHALNLSRAEVEGTVSFYHDFRRSPPGRHVLRVCRAEACQAVGGAALEAHVAAKLGCGYHETSASGVTLEPVYCLGNCACGPSLMIDGRLHGRVSEATFDELARAELA